MLEELITITKFLSLGEAKLAQGKLVSAGIAAFVCDENMHAMNWHMGMALGGIRLQVPDSQVVRALEVLDDFEPNSSDAVEADDGDEEEMEEVACCPECESLEIREVASPQPRQITLWSAAIPFPDALPQAVRHWKCLVCGYQWREADE
jgi:Putative prokaryotic signal transducing protein